jgi:flagellar L-ring protein precursor FlgH
MRIAVFSAVCIVMLASAAPGQVSLWDGDATMASDVNLLREVKGRDFKVHDIISIVVAESAEATTDEQAQTEKKNDKTNLLINNYLKLKTKGTKVNLAGSAPQDLSFDMTGDKKFQGQGQSDRTDSIRTKLAAEVVDIKPNGNLLLEAKHTLTKQREKTTITFSGLVRPADVGIDNTVFSYCVADADIRYESSGPITDANKRGWLSKILDKIWPF